MHHYSKEIKDRLHELATLAYEREIGSHLTELAKSFEQWNKKALTNAQMSRAIHEHHNGPAREVFRYYKGLDSDVLVARAIAQNLLKAEELPKDIFEIVKSKIDLFKN